MHYFKFNEELSTIKTRLNNFCVRLCSNSLRLARISLDSSDSKSICLSQDDNHILKFAEVPADSVAEGCNLVEFTLLRSVTSRLISY